MEDIEYRGRTFKKGQQLVMLLSSANRDASVFSDPARLDVTRENVRHLSFSQGNHYCLGAPLARMEGELAFRGLVRQFRTIELVEPRSDWGTNTVLRGLKSLPVRVTRN